MDGLRTRPATKSGVYMRWDVVRAPAGIDTSKLLYDISGGGTPNIKFRFGLTFQDEYQGKYTFRLVVRDLITGCQSSDTVDVAVIAEPTVVLKTVPNFCVNSGVGINLFDYILVNGVKPTSGSIFIQDVNGDRNDPRATTNISSGLFKVKTGAGVYNIKYTSSQFGCVKIDSFPVVVNDTPNLAVHNTTICTTQQPFDLSTLIDKGTKANVSYQYGKNFTGSVTTTGYSPGPYKIMLDEINQFGCRDTEYVYVKMVNQASVKFVKPLESCGSDTIRMSIDTVNLNNQGTLSWTSPTPLGGTNVSKFYLPTTADTTLGYVDARVDYTVNAPKVCANTSDTVRIYIHKYPDPMFTYQNGCEPLNDIFTPAERKGINPSILKYDWYVNGSSISTSNNSVPHLFTTQGKYQVTLSITNIEGKKYCNRTITQTVEIYPKPTAIFTTDPVNKTTIALPKFKTINTSSVNQTPFATVMKYNWGWGKTFKTGSDTVRSPNIIFGKDTGIYWIKLNVTTNKGCKDSTLKKVIIGPDIIIFVPDAFTPDNAGPNANNTFQPVILNYKTYQMLIFSRWGEKMYETTDLSKGWDGNFLGKPAQQGVYVYRIVVTSGDDKAYEFNGTFTLLR